MLYKLGVNSLLLCWLVSSANYLFSVGTAASLVLYCYQDLQLGNC